MNTSEHLNIIIEELEFSNGVVQKQLDPSYKKKDYQKDNPLKANLTKQAFDAIENLDAIYFSGEYPIIYFKKVNDINPCEIKSLHKKIWNQGRVPLLFLVTPDDVRIYNCFKEPLRENDNDIDKLQIDRFEQALDTYKKIRETYHISKIDSGEFWETESGKKINTSKKVDKLLVENLQAARATLLRMFKLKSDEAIPIIHNLLCRSLFVLYLEDRKVIDKNYYGKFSKEATSYFDILQSKSACYSIFRKLNKKYNGNLFITSTKEVNTVKNEHLEIIRECFYGDSLVTGQKSLWRMFDFSYIPIELISSIYEEFLHTEEKSDSIKKDGAYYTPLALVEFILNEILPFPDEKNTNYALKILDPACGSGIFLVEAYRRLVERWRYVNNYQNISTEDLRFILKNSIYGIEKNKEAIKVAAFSLYLTMLSFLKPEYIRKKVKIFPKLIHSKDNNEGHLFNDDTFLNSDYIGPKYDLVIGNPPWKRGNLDDTLKEYNIEHKFAQEAVLPFLHKMPQVAPNAQIALVSTAKILFNSSSGYENFRKFLFKETNVSSIINFSALRKSKGEIGRKLFSSASGPTIVIFYRSKDSSIKYFGNADDTIIYCSPKPQVRDSALAELIIDPVDIRFIPKAEVIDTKSNIWKISMWGTHRDKQLIDKFSGKDTLLDYFSNNEGWTHGGGFRVTEPQKYTDNYIKTLPFVPPQGVERYYSPKSNTTKISYVHFERLGKVECYKSPHIIIKDGQADKRFCASFLDYDCSYMYYHGIHCKGNGDNLKVITAYLNSKIATYLLFLSAASWGIERERVEVNNLFKLPAFDFLFDNKEFSAKIVEIFDEIIGVKMNFTMGAEDVLSEKEKKLDELFYKQLGLNDSELYLIHNIVDFSLDFFQEGKKSKAVLPTIPTELSSYCKVFINNLKNLLYDKRRNLWGKVYQVSPSSEMTVISIYDNNTRENGAIIFDDKSNVRNLLKKINDVVYAEYTESIYFRKSIKYFDKELGMYFIVKPNEKRFWTEAIALEDSDAAFIEWFN